MQSLRHILQQRPLGLAFDIDGTLSPIVSRPSEVRLADGVAELLVQAKASAQIAIITGRAIENGAAIVNVDDLTYVGTHGLEWCNGLPTIQPVQIEPAALAFQQAGHDLLDLAERELGNLPGILVERKRIGGAIHYRLCPNPEQARQSILDLLAEPARQAKMRLSEGKCVVEVKTMLAIHKGEALRKFVQRFQLRSVLFAGDDRTDLDAIQEVARLRAEEHIAGLSIVVQHEDTPAILLESADLIVQGVEGMVNLLRQIAEAIKIP